MYEHIHLSFKENIKIANTKTLIHSYERSGRDPFLNFFLFLLERLFSRRGSHMQKSQLLLQFTIVLLPYSAVPSHTPFVVL